jgi:hypothetical protein
MKTLFKAIHYALLLCVCPTPLLAQNLAESPNALVEGFKNPPAAAHMRCYWWWLNGHTTKATITRDLEQMHRKGFGGALLVDANGADQGGNSSVPAGPEFGSPAWTELYLHALKEADRLGLEITLNITSGWNLGGPGVKPEDASKLLTWSSTIVQAGMAAPLRMPAPASKNGFYRQIAVLAYPLREGEELAGEPGSQRIALENLAFKSAAVEVQPYSMPDATNLLTDTAPERKDDDTELDEVRDITETMDADGIVHWTAPTGTAKQWEILRIGYTDSDARVSTSSGAWQGLAIDYLDPNALDTYWKASVQPLLEAAKPYTGKTLKYVATDSWELGGTNWTGAFRQEFMKQRGYDPVPFLPVAAGRIVGSRDLSTRFLADLRQTVADLVTGHYDRMAELAKPYGLGIQCESGGPHGAPIDALETFRSSAIPQTEYWAASKEHRSSDADRFFVKEASSAAHIYGARLAAAEGMTSIGNQWSESIGDTLRPAFDRALSEGMNLLVWHAFTSSPVEMGLPGQEYFAGTHLNPNVTWWRYADDFFQYISRSQFLMQQGLPVSDILYYYGDNAPNFARLKADDPAHILPGYDYDVTDTDALLRRFSFSDGVLRTPEGIIYKALVLPQSRILPLSVLEFAAHYVESGGTVIGLRPQRSQGIVPAADAEAFTVIASHLWGGCEMKDEHERWNVVGKGKVLCTHDSAAAMQLMHVLPDVEVPDAYKRDAIDFAHRKTATEDIYFLRNTTPYPIAASVIFRVKGESPVIFHADTGQIESSLLFAPTEDGRTIVPISLDAHESRFFVFQRARTTRTVTALEHDGDMLYSAKLPEVSNLPVQLRMKQESSGAFLYTADPGSYKFTYSDGTTSVATVAIRPTLKISGPWTLSFPPKWGAPAELHLSALQSWTALADAGVRYFSGTATYRTVLHLTAAEAADTLSARINLGEVHEVAAVTLNGKFVGILWKAPYVIPVDGLLQAGKNILEVQVTNLWPNRLIGDAQPDAKQHYTWTNIKTYTKDSPLLPSGLFGPVTIEPVYKVTLTTIGKEINPR